MMGRSRLVALPLIASLVVACGGEEMQWAGSVSDSSGVAIVSNPEGGIWGAEGGWTVEEEVRIGALEGEPDYQFGQVGGVAVDTEGRIFVLDVQAQQIKIYTADGSYEQTIAQRGGGPGELQGAFFVLMAEGDTLLVPDVQNQRINRYAPDGSSLGSFRLSLEDGLPLQFRATGSGLLAKQVRPFAFPGQPEIENPMDRIERFAADGSVLDTLMTFESGETFRLTGGAPEFNIYSPEPTWDISDEGKLYFAINDDYRVKAFTAGGELERIITKPFEKAPVTERDKEAMLGFMERAWKDAGVPAQALEQLRNVVHFGEHFPAFASVVAGPAGTIWVQHIKTTADLSDDEYESFNPIEDTGGSEWDVFDAAGRYLGVVEMPHRFTPRLIRGERIYGVWRDELDVQYVTRLRVIGIQEYRERWGEAAD